MNLDETVLYNRDASGAIREWAICVIDWTIQIRYGQRGGTMQYAYEEVEEGKQSRSIDEQIISRVDSRISKQMDKGYVKSIGNLAEKSINRLGLFKPMLAQKIQDVRNIKFDGAFIQRKYDGNRCMIAHTPEGNVAYSRNGKKIGSIDHIINGIDLELGQVVDGELYCHGESLQTIVSWIKRKQPDTAKIQYHMYDIVLNAPFKDRLAELRCIQHDRSIQLAETYRIWNYNEAMKRFATFRNDGYEGAILRWGPAGYEDGKRSRSLVKIKKWLDAEYVVVDIVESKDGWGILVCAMTNGKLFRVSAPGSIPEKTYVANNKDKFIGREVTVEYAYKTQDGVPFHPIAKSWR